MARNPFRHTDVQIVESKTGGYLDLDWPFAGGMMELDKKGDQYTK